MIGPLFVTLREGFEAALIIGIVLAYLKRSDAADRSRHVWAGVAAAFVASLVMGGLLFASGRELTGSYEKLYESTAMLAAAAVLTWMIFWMQRQARTLGASLRQKVSGALVAGGAALFWVAFVTTAREGVETSLFMYAATGKDSPAQTLFGGSIGLLLAAALGVAVYRGGRRLDLGIFFKATSLVLLAFAAYLLYGGLHEAGELAHSGAFEMGAAPIALLYVVGVVWMYLRPPAVLVRQPAE
ncbi:MAG: FTR1 family iron permease [Solirubrobacteraceae bacterium]